MTPIDEDVLAEDYFKWLRTATEEDIRTRYTQRHTDEDFYLYDIDDDYERG